MYSRTKGYNNQRNSGFMEHHFLPLKFTCSGSSAYNLACKLYISHLTAWYSFGNLIISRNYSKFPKSYLSMTFSEHGRHQFLKTVPLVIFEKVMEWKDHHSFNYITHGESTLHAGKHLKVLTRGIKHDGVCHYMEC